MGLDVVFKADDAIKAGASFFMQANGTPRDVAEAKAIGDEEHAAWLQEQRCYMDIGLIGHVFDVLDKWPVPGDTLSVRANKWGENYAPLTDWLRKHSIEWYEW